MQGSLTLPNVQGSPNQHSRRINLGVSNRKQHLALPPRLCRAKNPHLLVEEQAKKEDLRHVIESMRNTHPVGMNTHAAHYHPPPSLPAASEILATLLSEPPEFRKTSPSVPPQGIPAILGQTGPYSLLPPPSRSISNVSRNSTTPRNSPRGPRHDQGDSAGSPPKQVGERLTAAQVFMKAEQYSKPTTLVLPETLSVQVRSGSHMFPNTFPLTQPEQGTALYAPPEERFDAKTRSLYSTRIAQEEKLRRLVASEIKTTIIREKEASLRPSLEDW